MNRFSRWLGGKPPSTATTTPLDEPNALANAMASAMLAMNDEVEQAEFELSEKTTPFHKLGRGAALFLRAGLGFEKEIMDQAGRRLAESEQSATEHLRLAKQNPSSVHQSAIYPVGAEFALCQAESQLMFAVIAVLNQNLTESLKGLYKIRKAFFTLTEIHKAEERYLQSRRNDTSSRASSIKRITTSASGTTHSNGLPANGTPPPAFHAADEDDDDDDFVDAEESNVEPIKLDFTPIGASTNVAPSLRSETSGVNEPLDFRTITSDPIDLYIHSGMSMSFGLIQLVLSMLPSAFAKVLAVFSFRGDRDAALKMLWSATNFTNDINGAIAGLTVLTLNSAIVAGSDILPNDPVTDRKRKNLIRELRKLYPKSKLWLLEEARSLTYERKIEAAVQLQTSEGESPLKQLEALRVFELSVNYMFLHRYEESAAAFLKCIELNSWSHASYYYHAGACYIELYRIHKSKDPQQAADYAEKANECLQQALATAGKTRIMGQKMPFDSFITRKMAKWQQRARAWDCPFVDAVGVSPLVEIVYFWNGYKRLSPPELLASQARLAWSEDPAAHPHHAQEPDDERALLAVLQGSLYRFQGDVARAKVVLRNQVLEYSLYQLKQCPHPDLWSLPVAHYELAVCYWEEAGPRQEDTEMLRQCDDELSKVTKWGSFDLDAGVELKVTLAKETLLKYGVGKA